MLASCICTLLLCPQAPPLDNLMHIQQSSLIHKRYSPLQAYSLVSKWEPQHTSLKFFSPTPSSRAPPLLTDLLSPFFPSLRKNFSLDPQKSSLTPPNPPVYLPNLAILVPCLPPTLLRKEHPLSASSHLQPPPSQGGCRRPGAHGASPALSTAAPVSHLQL